MITENIKKAIKSGKVSALAFDRVSTQEQAGGLSLAYQESHAEQYASRNNLYIVQFFTVAESARSAAKRKAFREMIDTAQRFNIKHLIFKNVDRMSRNYADLVLIEDLIDNQEYHIHFYQNNKILNADSNHNDRFILGIEIAVAKQLSDKISHDIRQANLFKARQGLMPKAKTGYIYDKQKRQYFIDPKKENLLRFIFDTFDAERLSIKELAVRLNEMGYKSPSNKYWRISYLHNVLTSEVYCGMFRLNGELFQGNHEPYFSVERFEERKKRLGFKFVGSRKRTYDFLLAGILRYQGHLLTGEIKKGRYVYYTNRVKRCTFRESDLLQWIDKYMESIEFTDDLSDYMKELFRESVEVKKENQAPSRSALSRKIADCELKLSKILDLFFEDGIDTESLKAKQTEIRAEINRLEKERNLLNVDKDKFIIKVSELIDSIRKIPAMYSMVGPEDRIDLLRTMIKHIKVKDSDVLIKWNQLFDSIINAVRTIPVNHATAESLRTIIYRISPELQLVFAA